MLGHDVHHVAPAQVISEEVAARSEPLDVTRLKRVSERGRAGDKRTPHHLPRIGGMIVAVEGAAYLRMDTIRGEDQLGVMRDAVGKTQYDARRLLIYGD